jgi:hypothetical protein
MEKDPSAIDLLQTFAEETHREITISEKEYPKSGIHPKFLAHNEVIIKDKNYPKLYFINYNDARAFGDSAFFSGFFFEVKAPATTQISLRKKYFFDRMKFFGKKSQFEKDFHNFNKKVIITENDYSSCMSIFGDWKSQETVLQILKLDPRLRIGVNIIDNELVKNTVGKSTIGIYVSNSWLFEAKLAEKLFGLVGKLTEEIRD